VEKSKKMLQSMKVSISKMIIAYNKSGNGTDMIADEEDLNEEFSKYGHFDPEMAKDRSKEGDNLIDGDDRVNFVAKGGGSIPSLYWWDTLDQHGLLHCTQGTMKGSCKADGKAASSTAYGSRPSSIKKKKRKGLNGSVIEADNTSELTESQTKVSQMIDRMTEVHEQMAEASNQNAIASHQQALAGDQQALVQIHKEIQSLNQQVFQLEDELDEETNPKRKARLESRLQLATEELQKQRDTYEALDKDITHRSYCLNTGEKDNTEDNTGTD
jgi:hypothetical protein